MKLLRSVKRLGTVPVRFRATVIVKRLVLGEATVLDPAALLSVVFQRGSKLAATGDGSVTPLKNVVEWNQPLVLVATLYRERNAEGFRFQGKAAKLTIRRKKESAERLGYRGLGVVTVDLAEFAGVTEQEFERTYSVGSASLEVGIALQWMRDYGQPDDTLSSLSATSGGSIEVASFSSEHTDDDLNLADFGISEGGGGDGSGGGGGGAAASSSGDEGRDSLNPMFGEQRRSDDSGTQKSVFLLERQRPGDFLKRVPDDRALSFSDDGENTPSPRRRRSDAETTNAPPRSTDELVAALQAKDEELEMMTQLLIESKMALACVSGENDQLRKRVHELQRKLQITGRHIGSLEVKLGDERDKKRSKDDDHR